MTPSLDNEKMHLIVLLLKHECYVKVEKNYAYEYIVFVKKYKGNTRLR